MNRDRGGGALAPPRWNLATSFGLPEDLDGVVASARRFRARHGGAVAGMGAAALAGAFREVEALLAPLQRAATYAEMVLACDAGDPTALALLDRCDEAWAAVGEVADAFEREVAALPEARVAALLADPALGPYAQHLRTVLAAAPPAPPPGTDQAVTALEPVALAGWERMARQLLGRIDVHDGPAPASLGAALPALYDADRERRHRTVAAISAALEAEVDLRATTLSMLARGRTAVAGLRGLPGWAHASHVVNAVDRAEVDALLEAVDGARQLPHDHYRAKAALLGELTDADRYAPLGDPPPAIDWADCRAFALDTLGAIAGELADIARDLLDGGAVDADPRPGKRRGALTFSPAGARPHVLLNFTGRPRDALTAVHELAHAAHARLAGHHGPLTAALPTVLAETVGLFAETVAADRLCASVDDPGARLSVLGRRVEDQLVAVFREAALHRFEREVHDRAADDVLDADELGERWLAGQRDLYGPAVALSPGYRHWWSYLDSLFLAPGTAWPYVYGQLAALALVEAHRDDPRRFGDRFVAVLAEGAGRPPAALLGSLGVDVGSPDGWRRGLDVLGEEVSALVALATAGAGVPRPRDGGPVAGGGDKGNDDGRR